MGNDSDNNGILAKWNGKSVGSGNVINHGSMNRDQFKDPVCYAYLFSCVVTSLSLTQGVVGLNHLFHKNLITEFSGTAKGKLGCVVMVTIRLVYLIVLSVVTLQIIRCQ